MKIQHCKTLPALTALAGLTLGFSAVDRAGADSFVEAASMRYWRASHTATLLRNGNVLVAGGIGGIRGESLDDSRNLKSAEIYDPATDMWARTGSLNVARRGATAVLLADGKVLFAGGYEHNLNESGQTNSAEIYDPATGRWRLIRPMTHARSFDEATLLPSGEVLVGRIPVELYDPATGSWREVDWPGGKLEHVLPNGKVLSLFSSSDQRKLDVKGWLYDPSTETWTRTSAPDHRVTVSSMLLSGEVLAWGWNFDFDAGEASTPASRYDYKTGSWTPTGPMIYNSRETSTLLPDGRVLVVAGIRRGNPGHSTSELYDPIRGIWRLGPSTNVERYEPTATVLHNGTVLVVGGASIAATNGHTAELFVPNYRRTVPSLNFLHSSNRILSFSWQGVGSLEQSSNLTDWEVAPLQDNPQVIATGSAAARFFRVNAGR